MRARNIKPGFFDNEELAECSMSARLLYVGLWCLADREGYVEYRPKKIKVKVFPYDTVNVVKLLDELRPFLSFVGDENEQWIHVLKFEAHQSPHKNEKPSKFNMLESYRVITCKFTEFHPDCLIEDCLIPDLVIPPAATKPGRVFSEEDFDLIWKQYPRKEGRKEALKHFLATVKKESDLLDISTALANFKRKLEFEKTETKYIPHGSKWFNNWRDYVDWVEPAMAQQAITRKPQASDVMLEKLRRLTDGQSNVENRDNDGSNETVIAEIEFRPTA